MILSSLQKYETRITVDEVEVETASDTPSQLHITVHYRLLRTNAAQQVGVSMTQGWQSASNTPSA